MLQALSFIVHLPPLHTEKFSQHAFNQVMTQRELPGDLASCCRQSDLAITLHAHQFILLQPAQSHGHGRRRNLQQVGQTRRDHRFTLALGCQDGLEIVFFGDGDHLRLIIRRRIINDG